MCPLMDSGARRIALLRSNPSGRRRLFFPRTTHAAYPAAESNFLSTKSGRDSMNTADWLWPSCKNLLRRRVFAGAKIAAVHPASGEDRRSIRRCFRSVAFPLLRPTGSPVSLSRDSQRVCSSSPSSSFLPFGSTRTQTQFPNAVPASKSADSGRIVANKKLQGSKHAVIC